jgi:hypothetical protein
MFERTRQKSDRFQPWSLVIWTMNEKSSCWLAACCCTLLQFLRGKQSRQERELESVMLEMATVSVTHVQKDFRRSRYWNLPGGKEDYF